MLRVDPRPLYMQAAEKIEEYIRQANLQPADRLPAEATLAEQLGISRSTLREALRELALRGRIDRVHGRGTLVAEPPPVVSSLGTLESLEALAARQGWQCGTERVAIREVPLTAALAGVLAVPEGAPGVYLTRVKTRDGRPICRMETWLPAAVMSARELQERFEYSITDALLAGQRPRLDYAMAEVGATAANAETAALLAVPEGSPLVVLMETFYEHPARPLCYSANAFVPASVRLEVLRRPAGTVG